MSTKNLAPSSNVYQSNTNLDKKGDGVKTEKVNNYTHSEIHVKKCL